MRWHLCHHEPSGVWEETTEYRCWTQSESGGLRMWKPGAVSPELRASM